MSKIIYLQKRDIAHNKNFQDFRQRKKKEDKMFVKYKAAKKPRDL